MLRLMTAILISMFPRSIHIYFLRKQGAKIGKNSYIGFLAVLDSKNIEIGDNVQIASFNLLHRLVSLRMENGSRMNGFNWVTGAKTGSLSIGKNSAVTRLHFFEASGDITIGENSIIAGRNSHFFTHGISATNLEDVRPITIGPWCYIGSSSRFTPGSGVSRGTFVGMGAVVTKNHSDQFVLIAGNPAVVRKELSQKDIYFSRSYLPHDHHPEDYNGL